MNRIALTALALACSVASAPAAESPGPVTADNFIRAESDAVFTGLVAQGALASSSTTAN